MNHLIRQMGYVVFESPDPVAAAEDLETILNIRVSRRGDGFAAVSSNSRSVEVAFLRGETNGVLVCGLEAMDGAALDEALRRVKQEGFEILSDRPLIEGPERGFRFATPFGPILEIHTPVPRDDFPHNTGAGAPRRLDHVNLRASDVRGFHDFATSVLGMKLSDRTTQMERIWLRGWDGYHHTVAVGPGEGFHHYGFEAVSFESLLEMADRLTLEDRQMLWGPGRHGAGDNVFTYYLDRDGRVVENSWGMERIDNDDLHRPRNWDMQGSKRVLNLWGPLPPQSYIERVTPFVRDRTATTAETERRQ